MTVKLLFRSKNVCNVYDICKCIIIYMSIINFKEIYYSKEYKYM